MAFGQSIGLKTFGLPWGTLLARRRPANQVITPFCALQVGSGDMLWPE
jgi:hypothetical protein